MRRDSANGKFSDFRHSVSFKKICSACGAQASRETARFCLTCGKLLKEDYQPLDALRASYRLQGKTFDLEAAQKEEVTNLFQLNENAVSETAWACFVYSMVPYLGILFVPLTIIIGSFGLMISVNKPQLGGKKLSLASIGLSFVVLAVQIFLWWLLYVIPELGRTI